MTTTAPKRKGAGGTGKSALGTGRPAGAYPPDEISFVSPSLHLKELERDIIQLKLELAESKTLNAYIMKQRDDATSELAEANKRNARTMRERDELRAELDKAERQIDDLVIENTNLRFSSVKLSHDMDIFQQENEELDRRNRYLEEHQHHHEQRLGRRSSGFSQGTTASINSIAEATSGSETSISRHASSRSIDSRPRSGLRSSDKMESSSKLISALDIYTSIEDKCLDSAGETDIKTRRMSDQTSRNSSISSIILPERNSMFNKSA